MLLVTGVKVMPSIYCGTSLVKVPQNLSRQAVLGGSDLGHKVITYLQRTQHCEITMNWISSRRTINQCPLYFFTQHSYKLRLGGFWFIVLDFLVLLKTPQLFVKWLNFNQLYVFTYLLPFLDFFSIFFLYSVASHCEPPFWNMKLCKDKCNLVLDKHE